MFRVASALESGYSFLKGRMRSTWHRCGHSFFQRATRPRALVIITSEAPLARLGLARAAVHLPHVDLPDPDSARDLVRNRPGEGRSIASDAVIDETGAVVGHLPLALALRRALCTHPQTSRQRSWPSCVTTRSPTLRP